MDTITHGVAGAVFARTLAQRPGARAALLLGLLAAMLPDLDLIFVADRLEYIRHHRGWTHSFLFLPLLALAVAIPARLLFRHARLANLWLFSAMGIATHILFDWITSFGTMFWSPLTRARYHLDWVFILDPFFTAIVAATLFGTLLFRRRGRAIAGAGAVLLVAYVLLCGWLHGRALETWRRLDRPPPGARTAVLPQFLSPFRWLGLSDRDDAVHAAFFDIGPFARGVADPRPPRRLREIFRSLSDFYPPPERARIRRFSKPGSSPALSRVLAMPEVAAYRSFARFPLATVRIGRRGDAEVTLEDLRFLPWFSGPWGRRKAGGFGREAFVYRVRLDSSGRLLERGFVIAGRVR